MATTLMGGVTALYRPETFTELIGQSHVTDPLRATLRSDRVNHVYRVSGPRGCGKITSMRILARRLNCVEGPLTPRAVCAPVASSCRGRAAACSASRRSTRRTTAAGMTPATFAGGQPYIPPVTAAKSSPSTGRTWALRAASTRHSKLSKSLRGR